MRLLVVEDDPALRSRLSNELAGAGYAVDLAENGLTGEMMVDHFPYDAVVLDLGLPGRSGLDVLRSWRAKGKKVSVLILTARGQWQEKVEGFAAGADDYLAKPFHTEELLARLSALIRRSHGAASGKTITQGGVTLDETTQSIITEEGPVSLTGVEFRLLRYFMLNPGRVLSKERLTEHVYEFDADKESNVIEVYVNRLRQKVGRDLIQTRRGQGYVFG